MKKIIVILALAIMLISLNAEPQIDIGTTIYNQYRWTNGIGGMGAHTFVNGSRDDVLKGNFIRTEVEYKVNASISRYVKAYLRAKTIWDADDSNSSVEANAAAWQTYWDYNTGWFKLRGFRIDVMPEIQYIDQIQLGTVMGLSFSKWFMADRRYIDRDNTKGIYLKGNFGGAAKWNLIRVWNPNWLGPDWNTGDFVAEDGTWAININSSLSDNFQLAFDGVLYEETEFDFEDIDNPNYDGSNDDETDGHMDVYEDYTAFGLGLSGNYDLSDVISIDFNGMITGQVYDDVYDPDEDNIVDYYGIWMVAPKYKEVASFSGIFSVKTSDPFDMGLSPNFQFFNINHNYVSYWGSRREDDLLMIDGGIDAIRDTYGVRLGLDAFLWESTQNGVTHYLRDNENLRLGETLMESPCGYWGATFDFDYDTDFATFRGQFNLIGATDNADKEEEDDNYDGDGTMYLPERDFAATTFLVGASKKMMNWDLDFEFRHGVWEESVQKLETIADVIEFTVGKQLTKTISFEINPAYQMVYDHQEPADRADDLWETEMTNICFSEKIIYNFGGFDFWLRGEHNFKNTIMNVNGYQESDVDTSSSALHAAWEVKF